jgi:hypothetical protein
VSCSKDKEDTELLALYRTLTQTEATAVLKFIEELKKQRTQGDN